MTVSSLSMKSMLGRVIRCRSAVEQRKIGVDESTLRLSKIGITGLHKGTASDLCTSAENSPILWEVTRSKGLRTLVHCGIGRHRSAYDRMRIDTIVGLAELRKEVKMSTTLFSLILICEHS